MGCFASGNSLNLPSESILITSSSAIRPQFTFFFSSFSSFGAMNDRQYLGWNYCRSIPMIIPALVKFFERHDSVTMDCENPPAAASFDFSASSFCFSIAIQK